MSKAKIKPEVATKIPSVLDIVPAVDDMPPRRLGTDQPYREGVLVLSTRHITPEDGAKLDLIFREGMRAMPENYRMPPYLCGATEFGGVFATISKDELGPLSTEVWSLLLGTVLIYASTLGWDYVMFDGDARLYRSLPVSDAWE